MDLEEIEIEKTLKPVDLADDRPGPDEVFREFKVCWYNIRKGYGFVKALDGSGEDVFIHRKALYGFGLEYVEADDELYASVVENKRGKLIRHIQQIRRPNPPEKADRTDGPGEGEFIYVLKFFDALKGFGFASPETKDAKACDVFVHARNLRAAKIRYLEECQRLVIEPMPDGNGGLMAKRVKLLNKSRYADELYSDDVYEDEY